MNEKDMESLQKKARLRNRIAMFTAVAALLCLMVFLFWFVTAPLGGYSLQETEDYNFLEMAIIVLAIPLFLSLGIYGLLYTLFVKRSYERFNSAFKQNYVLQTVREAGGIENLHYDPKGGISYAEIYDSMVVACGDQKYYEREDLLTGTFYGMRFAYCDVITKYLKRREKKAELETIFQGQIMRFSLPEDSKWSFGHLQIFEKEFLSNFKGRTSPHRVQTENEGFNRRFQVFAADEHNAFYLLTPQMLEKILHFADLADCQIALTFVGPSLYVAMNRPHSIFNASMTESFAQQQQTILQDVRLLQQAGELLALETVVLGKQAVPETGRPYPNKKEGDYHGKIFQ